MRDEMLAVNYFLEQILRDVEVVIGGFETDAGVARLESIELAGEIDLGAQQLDEFIANRFVRRSLKLVAKIDETRLVGCRSKMD